MGVIKGGTRSLDYSSYGYAGLLQRYVGFNEIIKTRSGSPWNKGCTSRGLGFRV